MQQVSGQETRANNARTFAKTHCRGGRERGDSVEGAVSSKLHKSCIIVAITRASTGTTGLL